MPSDVFSYILEDIQAQKWPLVVTDTLHMLQEDDKSLKTSAEYAEFLKAIHEPLCGNQARKRRRSESSPPRPQSNTDLQTITGWEIFTVEVTAEHFKFPLYSVMFIQHSGCSVLTLQISAGELGVDHGDPLQLDAMLDRIFGMAKHLNAVLLVGCCVMRAWWASKV
ncbi:hypothetical protein McanCB56680_006787 [Microsporum canis]